jgi:tricorn protease
MRHLDVSDNQITFVYGGDIWTVDKAGGTAIQLTNSPGEESWPKFSPDGKSIAYTASYAGNQDVYKINTNGGMPLRITYQSLPDRMVDWHPDGTHLLFASRRESGIGRTSQFFKVSENGGFPEKLKVPYGELASFSPDGNKLAYVTKMTENFPFKRYRGGLTSDIIVFDLINNTAENISNDHAIDGKPAWVGDQIYFISDRDENMRLNIWVYNTVDGKMRQLSFFEDFDITYMAAGKEELVYEAGGQLYLMDLSTEKSSLVDVNIISDLSGEMVRTINVGGRIRNMTAAPEGKRIIFEARGELFNVPLKEGYVVNMTQSSSDFDREPSWSPDGKYIAYWSDKSGENEIYLSDIKNDGEHKKLTNRNKGYGYSLQWSPDSKYIVFIDETNDISIINIDSGETIVAGNTYWNVGHGARHDYGIAWSSDSKWITFHKGLDNAHNAIILYNIDERKTYQVTSGFYDDRSPVFSADNKYLFYLTNRNLSPIYSDMGDGTWVYPNATQIAAISLTREVPSLLQPKNDKLELKEDEENKEGSDAEEKDEKSDKKKDKKKKKGAEKDEEPPKEAMKIDLEDMEARLQILPPKAGNIGGILTFEGKLVYLRFPNSGSGESNASLMLYDLESREEKEIMSGINSVVSTADGKSMLVGSKGKYGIIKPAPGQKIEDAIPTDGLNMDLVPREEWRQLFLDAWRRHRDFFYDAGMHQLNWEAIRDQYGPMIEDARTRWDVTHIISNMCAELSAGHTYTFGGDVEQVKPQRTGYLGIDWELVDKGYRIKRIIKPASWDMEVRSPFDRPGVEVAQGDYILSVNGILLDPEKEPYAVFNGYSGKTVSLKISKTGNQDDAKEVIIECLSPRQETQLRYLEWLENNRKMVDELSDGKLGYVYMSNTSGRGQLELVRMFYGQLDKKGFIIDERFNGGGQLADRFLELLKRPVVYNLHWRHGRDHQHPVKTNTGPLGMLINGWAGSGGDGLPWAFQELEAGPIVGERTIGILVGPATRHQLIDGGGITVPGARLYDNDGHWFWEGEGVAPDIEVWDDPNILVQGRDPQMERVVEEVMKLLEKNPSKMTPAPALEDRTAQGLKGKN